MVLSRPDWFLYCRFWVIRPWPLPSGNPALYQSLSRLFRPPPVPQAPPPPPHPPLPVPEELLSRTSNIRSFKKLLTLQSEFKMSSFQPVFSGKYYILNISLLWSLFETFNFFNLSRGIYFKNIAFYIHALKPLAKVFWLIPSHRWDLFHCVP
jgi:hypothetical protein